jgi:hypothetical protein
MKPKFDPGSLPATPQALVALERHNKNLQELLRRHLAGDWGDLGDDDRRLNDLALIDGSRLLSSYTIADDLTVWIITEATDDAGNRLSTTVLLPSQY